MKRLYLLVLDYTYTLLSRWQSTSGRSHKYCGAHDRDGGAMRAARWGYFAVQAVLRKRYLHLPSLLCVDWSLNKG